MTDRANRRILLITPNSLTAHGVGSLFLRDLLAAVPDINIIVARVPRFLLDSRSDRFRQVWRLWGLLWSRSGSLQGLRLAIYRRFFLDRAVNRISGRVDLEGVDRLWVTASSPEVIAVAEQLVRRGRDLRVTIWDAPEYLAGNLRLSVRERRRLFQSFEDLMQRASAATVSTAAMQRDYQGRFGIPSEVLRHGIDVSPWSVAPRPHEEIRVIFAGSLYAKTEWNCFVKALTSARWTINERKVVVYFLGRFPLAGADRPKEVVLLGEKPFDEAMTILSDMDIGYVPYWFAKDREVEARTSFPGKMSAYGVAGLAVFHHGPLYTEVTQFLRDYPFGVACATLEIEGLLRDLGQLVSSMGSSDFRVARERAVREELSADAMAVRFRRFLGRMPRSE